MVPTCKSPLGSFRRTLSLLVGSHLQLVAAQVHAAPPPGALLAHIKEVQDAGFTPSNATDLRSSEKLRSSPDNHCPQVGRPLQIECFPFNQSGSLFLKD